jgi:hypothetical protein
MENSFVTCNLIGGLGNQLFQIFTTLAYSLKHKIRFCFPNYQGMKGIDGISERNAYWDNILSNLKQHIRQITTGVVIREKTSHKYNELPKPIAWRNMVLCGYFQCPKYFNEYSENIINILNFKKIQERIGVINAISMHFRIGDYKANPKFHPILSVDYYKKALNDIILKTDKNDWVVKYCCEDEDIKDVENNINEMINTFPNLSFERIDNKLADWEQMFHMSCCKHNIIANSSFSWWAAYLNKNSDKVVCYPETWFGEISNIKDMNEMFKGLGWKKY